MLVICCRCSSPNQLSIINYQLSINNYQLSIINYQLTTINYQLITVTFDGKVLKPEIPLNLEVNQKYQIQVIIDSQKPEINQENAWDILEDLAGTYNAPKDWSSEHNHYLYHTPKTNLAKENESI